MHAFSWELLSIILQSLGEKESQLILIYEKAYNREYFVCTHYDSHEFCVNEKYGKMLYGNVIFIKKSGDDGSKFPVTSTNLYIGRSDDCIIRIQNPLISPKHCQLMIGNDGQARIKNLSSTNPTVLNDQPLGNGKHVLHQGDILKLGERFARWEYLPSSKYYPTARNSGPLVAVVAHSPRYSEESLMETSPVLGNSAKKQKRRHTGAGRGSLGRSLKITPGSTKTIASTKQLVLRHSLQLRKFGLSPQIKLRSSLLERSVSGTPKMNPENTTPVRKSQKWEVKSVSPPNKVKSTGKNGINRKSTPIKMPMIQILGENPIKSGLKNASKAPNLLTIEELSLANVQRVLSERATFDDAPKNINLSISPKTPYKTSKTPNKIKINSQSKSLSKSSQKKSISRALKDLQSSFTSEENKDVAEDSTKFSPSERIKLKRLVVSNSTLQNEITDSGGRVTANGVTSEKLSGMPVGKRKSSVLLASNISSESMSEDDMETKRKISPKIPKPSPATSGRGKNSNYLKTSPVSTPRKVDGLSRGKKLIPSGVLDTPVGKENVKTTPRKKVVSSGKKLKVTSTQKGSQNRGVKRKLSALASAERAAKKLKTIAPTKPDKNKKAALLVLGKASGKLKVPQSSNIVIKKKIVKRAIKQFTLNREKSGIRKVNKAEKAQQANKVNVDIQKSPNWSPGPSANSTKRHSTPIGKTPMQPPTRSSSRKSVTSDDLVKSENCTSLHRNKKSISSMSSISGSDSVEVLHGSLTSRYSEKKSVSFSSTNSSIEYKSPNLGPDIKHPISKRLRSRCSDSSPEFTELSPFALGLTPKRMDDFKSQRQKGRRSFCMATPKNNSPVGIIKSASTSKINRKLVALTDKDSNNSSYLSLTSDAMFDLNEIQTPNVTIDFFVSPLSQKNTLKLRTQSSVFKNYQKDFLLGKDEKYPTPEQSPDKIKPDQNIDNGENSATGRKSLRVLNLKSAKKNSKPQKSPKNDLTDVRGVRRLMESAGRRKSPKNDLTDVRGVRRLMESAGRRKSPKNDLTDVRGVRRLMESAGRRKSPKNDLTDVRGVRKLFEQPKKQKSPKNDLTDLRGVRKLMELPTQRKSPRNDLTNVSGVKRLLLAQSPKNDLSNVSGLDILFKSPPNKIQCLRTVCSTEEDQNLSGVSQFAMENLNTGNVDVGGVAELFVAEEKVKTPKRKTRNTNLSPPALSSERRLLRRATKAAAEMMEGSDMTKTRKKENSTSEVPVDENLKVVRRGRKTDLKDEIEESNSRRTRAGSVREAKAIEGMGKSLKNLIAEEVTSRRTRASSKLSAGNECTKRPATPSKSPTPVKRTRKTTVTKIKVEVSKQSRSSKIATVSNSKKEVLKTSARKSESGRSARKSTPNEPLEVTKNTRSKAIESVPEVREAPAAPESSRSLRQRSNTKTKTVQEPAVSPVATRQRKARAVSSAKKKETKSSPVRTRRRAK